MRKFSSFIRLILLFCLVIILPVGAQGKERIKFQTDPPQKIDASFRLFKTDNMWTYLLLDTRNGRIWQVNFTVSEEGVRTKIPINLKPLVNNEEAKNGRFTLYPTDNMWNFLLLDQEDGRVWQCQFSLKEEGLRIILPIEPYAEKPGTDLPYVEKPLPAGPQKPLPLLPPFPQVP